MTDLNELVREAVGKRIEYLNAHPDEAQHLRKMARYDAAQYMRKVDEGQAATSARYWDKRFKG